MNIVILTGSEIRHKYFVSVLNSNKKINILKVISEGKEKSLKNLNLKNKNISEIEIQHESERYYLEKKILIQKNKIDKNKVVKIKKGEVNNISIINLLRKLSPDLVVSYGSSIIKELLINSFNNKFLNIHLGLSPYYRGAGTNIWPLINNEPQYVGVTYMKIDKGIDTGEILHQIRAKYKKNDSPHDIGNRLIKDMSKFSCKLIINFFKLKKMKQI